MNYFRRACGSDARFLSELAFRAKAHWGYTPEFMDACQRELCYTPIQIDDNNDIYTVAIKEDDIVGFYKLENIHHPRIVLDDLFVEPSLMGLGIGKMLFEDAKQTAINHHGLYLDVQSDPNAKDFYENMGMSVTGQQQSDVIKGRFLPTLTMSLTS